MKVDYLYLDKPHLASSRYRAIIPFKVMQKNYGVELGTDILIASKHSWEWDRVTKPYNKVVFDVCDDHFNTKHRDHYLNACKKADLITCNSETMREIILRETGKYSVVIDDPYEDEELEPSIGDSLLWFGHRSNLPDLWETDLRGFNLRTVSNHSDTVQWSPESLDSELRECGIVVIPTGKSMAKSANRAIKATRYGKFVVCGYLPAHDEIPGLWMGNIREGVEWAFANQDQAREHIYIAQKAVAYRFNPERIGAKWWATLSALT